MPVKQLVGSKASDGSQYVTLTDGAGNLAPLSNTTSGTLGFAATQATVTTTAAQIIAARANRNAVTITNLGTTDVWIGATGVTTSTGMLLLGSKGSSITIPTNAALFAIVGTGTQAVSILETF